MHGRPPPPADVASDLTFVGKTVNEALLLSLSNPKAGLDGDFESWLRGPHVEQLRASPGVASARCFKLMPIPYPAPAPQLWKFVLVCSCSTDSVRTIADIVEGNESKSKPPSGVVDADTRLLASAVPIGTGRVAPGAASTERAELFLVMTNALSGEDDAFNDWYDNRHLADVMSAPGIVAARRYRLARETAGHQSPWSYLALYEIAPGAAESTLAALLKLRGTAAMPLSPSFRRDDFYAKAYTPIS